MAAGRSVSVCLIVCFLVCSSKAQEKITADVGKNVTLPCKTPNNKNTAVEWSRPDQEPHYYVLFYRDGRLDPYNQHPSYQNRVDLQDKEMKDGDFSLILKNVTMEDRGTYECRVFEKGKKNPISSFYLEVYPSGNMVGLIGESADKDGGNNGGSSAGYLVTQSVTLAVVSVVFLNLI